MLVEILPPTFAAPPAASYDPQREALRFDVALRSLHDIPPRHRFGSSVQSGIPVPPKRGPNRPFPWRTIEVGESFHIPSDAMQSIRPVCTYYKNRYGRQFTTRKEGAGIRVWRTA